MHSTRWFTTLAAVASFAFGCSHEGEGSGTLEKPGADTSGSEAAGVVDFHWESGANASSGRIRAVAQDGRVFEGTYIQPTSAMRAEDYAPYWDAWSNMSWGAAAPWYVGSEDEFATAYSGKALAHLTAADGTRMRCTFVLREPVSGLAGGGQGDCQLSTHETVFNAVLEK